MTILLSLTLVLAFTACEKKSTVLSEAERELMMKNSEIVIEAKYKKVAGMRELRNVDGVEAREGYTKKVEKGVLFTVTKVLKGRYNSDEITVAVGLPSMAFGIKPGEYAGQKKYTLYFKYDAKRKKQGMIGAEWEEVKPGT